MTLEVDEIMELVEKLTRMDQKGEVIQRVRESMENDIAMFNSIMGDIPELPPPLKSDQQEDYNQHQPMEMTLANVIYVIRKELQYQDTLDKSRLYAGDDIFLLAQTLIDEFANQTEPLARPVIDA